MREITDEGQGFWVDSIVSTFIFLIDSSGTHL